MKDQLYNENLITDDFTNATITANSKFLKKLFPLK